LNNSSLKSIFNILNLLYENHNFFVAFKVNSYVSLIHSKNCFTTWNIFDFGQSMVKGLKQFLEIKKMSYI